MGNLIRSQDIWRLLRLNYTPSSPLEARLLRSRYSVQLNGISLVQSLLYTSRWQYLQPTLHAYNIIEQMCSCHGPRYHIRKCFLASKHKYIITSFMTVSQPTGTNFFVSSPEWRNKMGADYHAHRCERCGGLI